MELRPLDIFITTGASKEIDFITTVIAEMGGKAVPEKALTKSQAGYRCEVPSSTGDVIRFGLAAASNDGKTPQTNLLKRICNEGDPRIVVLVGMMGGIPGRVNLFDVVVPTVIYDGTTVGADKDGKPKWTKTSRSMHERFGSVAATFGGGIAKDLKLKISNNKRVVTTGGTIEDVDETLFSEIVSYDKDEIVGMEMEGYAIFEASTDQQHEGKNVIFGFVKGVADYGVANVSDEQITAVRNAIPELAGETNIQPRSNEKHKSAIQAHATALAFKTAIRLIEML